jgi:DNA-binding response OmpR family regulator
MAHGHVLIIDDELRADDALTKCLSFDGFTVECARTGAEGLARAAARHPDAIVLDLRLPDILGLSVLSELRRARLGVPVVVLTGAFLDEGHEVAARALGAAAYLHKPIIGDELTLALRSAIIAPPPELAAPVMPNDIPKPAPRIGRSSDALSARISGF